VTKAEDTPPTDTQIAEAVEQIAEAVAPVTTNEAVIEQVAVDTLGVTHEEVQAATSEAPKSE